MSRRRRSGATAASAASNSASTSSRVARSDPGGDRRVDLVDVRRAPRARREPGLLDQVGPADEPKDAGRDRVGARRHRHPGAVRRAVDVSRRVVARAVSGARLQRRRAGRTPSAAGRAASSAARPARCRRPGHGPSARARGARRGSRMRSPGRRRRPRAPAAGAAAGRRARRSAAAKPLIASASEPKPGRLRVRARSGRSRSRARARAADSRRRARPSRAPIARASPAGSSRARRPTRSASRRKSSAPSGFERSRVTRRLFLASVLNQSPTPSLLGPCPRAGSGRRGCSILITSAPKSPRSIPASGAANSVAASTTRIPSSGFVTTDRPPAGSRFATSARGLRRAAAA